MQENRALKRSMKTAAGICMPTSLLISPTGCGTGGVFDGSRAPDASGFRMEYSILNRRGSADLNLTEGDRLQVSPTHTEGNVDMTVGMEGKAPICRGSRRQNAEFIPEIAETGGDPVSVAGHRAMGNVSFIRIPGGQK